MKKMEKIDKIYEVIANKELDIGCIIMVEGYTYEEFIYIGKYSTNRDISEYMDEYGEKGATTYITKIIGHPVMIGDVLGWMFESGVEFLGGDNDKGKELLSIWLHLRKPIDDQQEKCIDFIYSLINENIPQTEGMNDGTIPNSGS